MAAHCANNRRMNERKQPDPLEDLRQGLGLILRAAKNAVQQLPSEKLSEAVVSAAREVSRAIEHVAQTVEAQIFRKGAPPPPTETPAETPAEPSQTSAAPTPPSETPSTKANGEGPPRG